MFFTCLRKWLLNIELLLEYIFYIRKNFKDRVQQSSKVTEISVCLIAVCKTWSDPSRFLFKMNVFSHLYNKYVKSLHMQQSICHSNDICHTFHRPNENSCVMHVQRRYPTVWTRHCVVSLNVSLTQADNTNMTRMTRMVPCKHCVQSTDTLGGVQLANRDIQQGWRRWRDWWRDEGEGWRKGGRSAGGNWEDLD